MNYDPLKKPRINHFILWCKHWYVPVDTNMSLLEQCKRILKLDEYVCVKTFGDVLCILTKFIDDYNQYLVSKGEWPFTHMRLLDSINKNMYIYKMDYPEAVIYAYRDFLAYDTDREHMTLERPKYNKELYKLGFKYSSKHGETYKECNRIAKDFFNKDK